MRRLLRSRSIRLLYPELFREAFMTDDKQRYSRRNATARHSRRGYMEQKFNASVSSCALLLVSFPIRPVSSHTRIVVPKWVRKQTIPIFIFYIMQSLMHAIPRVRISSNRLKSMFSRYLPCCMRRENNPPPFSTKHDPSPKVHVLKQNTTRERPRFFPVS